MAHESWPNRLLAIDRASAAQGVSEVRSSLHGSYYLKNFSCWDQFLAMAFAQLTYRESQRDIEACLRSLQNKL